LVYIRTAIPEKISYLAIMFRIWRFALLSLAAVVSAQMESLDPCGVGLDIAFPKTGDGDTLCSPLLVCPLLEPEKPLTSTQVDCYNQALNKAGAFNCGANDLNCLCRVPDFGFAIRDCAEGACPPGYAPTVTNSASAMCASE
jgi:hypothetical protein